MNAETTRAGCKEALERNKALLTACRLYGPSSATRQADEIYARGGRPMHKRYYAADSEPDPLAPAPADDSGIREMRKPQSTVGLVWDMLTTNPPESQDSILNAAELIFRRTQ